MRSTADNQGNAAVIAVVHRAGGETHLVMASIDGPRPKLLEARTISDLSDRVARELFESHQPGRVIDVLSASQVICRTCTLPDASDEHLAQALALQAEAQRTGDLPAHRFGSGVLEHATGESTRTGVLVSWPISSTSGLDMSELTCPVMHAPVVAAVAALMGRERPAEPIIAIDRSNDSVAMALPHANGVLVRATQESADDSTEWLRGIQRVTVESALSVGHAMSFAEHLFESCRPALARAGRNDATCFIPESIVTTVRSRFDGLPADAAWFERYGIAVGTVLAATSSLAGACGLAESVEEAHPGGIERLVYRLSQPRTAVAAVIAALFILGVAPVAASGVRLAILKARHPDIAERKERVDDIKSQLAMFSALENRSWSITKILADLMCAMPDGIEVESIRINTEQGVTITGTANKRDMPGERQILEMQRLLNNTRVFTNVSPQWDPPNRMSRESYDFTLTASVVRPHYRPTYKVENDYGAYPLIDRISGDPPPSTSTSEPASADDDPTPRVADRDDPAPDRAGDTERPGSNAPDRPTRDRPDGLGTAGETSSGDSLEGGAGGVELVPLTKEQIAALSEDEAKARLTENSSFQRRVPKGTSEDLLKALAAERMELFAHLRSLRGQN